MLQKVSALTQRCDESEELVADLRAELGELDKERLVYMK
jgi:hypothetical protein